MLFRSAIRIKPDSASNYSKNPFTEKFRNGLVLRGTVLKVVKTTYPGSCPINENTKYPTKTYVTFIDSSSKNEDYIEMIPIEAIDLIGPKINLPSNVYVFENYNDPLKPKSTREVRVDSTYIDTCRFRCKCGEVSIGGLGLPSCVKRNYSWFFAELRAGYAVYNDFKQVGVEIGRESFLAEAAWGLRFGAASEWGIGVAFSWGLKAYNSYLQEDVPRPLLMLHGRWQSDKDRFYGMCMKPFIYGQLGLSVDELSINLGRLKLNDDCGLNTEIEKLPNIDFNLPISYGFGGGFDIPVAPFLDLSLDLGYRSLAFGETVQTLGFKNIPTLRRTNVFFIRLGVTY